DDVGEAAHSAVASRSVPELQRSRIGPGGLIKVAILGRVEVAQIGDTRCAVVPVRPLDAVEQQTGKIVIHGDDERTAAVEADDAVERPPLQDLGQEPGGVLAKGQLVSAGEVEDVGNVVLAQTPFAGLRVERILHGATAALSTLGAIVEEPRPDVERAELEAVREALVEIDLERIVTALADGHIAIFDRLILRIGPQSLGDDAGEARI